MSNLLILGAGVEKTLGVDMPLANELVPQIRHFLCEDEIGQKVEGSSRNDKRAQI